MTKEETVAYIYEYLSGLLVELHDDFDLLEEATDEALNQIYHESCEVVDN